MFMLGGPPLAAGASTERLATGDVSAFVAGALAGDTAEPARTVATLVALDGVSPGGLEPFALLVHATAAGLSVVDVVIDISAFQTLSTCVADAGPCVHAMPSL